MLHSRHYGTPAVAIQGEDWSKIYGPYLIYVNAAPGNAGLWADAKARAANVRPTRILFPSLIINITLIFGISSFSGNVRKVRHQFSAFGATER